MHPQQSGGKIVHIHIIFALALHKPMGIGAQPLDCFHIDRIPFLNQLTQRLTHVQHILEHDTISDQLVELDAFFHLNRIVIQDLPIVSER